MSGRAPLSRTLSGRAAAAAALLLLVPACTADVPASREAQPQPTPPGPVDVPVPTTAAPLVVSSCSALLRAVPEELGDGLKRREVTGDPLRTAAWGDPAVTASTTAAGTSTGPVAFGAGLESLVQPASRASGRSASLRGGRPGTSACA